jgi:hypothetical protein
LNKRRNMKKILAAMFLGISLIIMAIVPVGAATHLRFWSQINPGEPVVKLDNSGYDNVYSWGYLYDQIGEELPPQGWLNLNSLNISIGTYSDQNDNFPRNFTVQVSGIPSQYISQTSVQVRVPRIGTGDEGQYATKAFNFNFPRNFTPRTYELTIKIFPTSNPECYQSVNITLQVVKTLP